MNKYVPNKLFCWKKEIFYSLNSQTLQQHVQKVPKHPLSQLAALLTARFKGVFSHNRGGYRVQSNLWRSSPLIYFTYFWLKISQYTQGLMMNLPRRPPTLGVLPFFHPIFIQYCKYHAKSTAITSCPKPYVHRVLIALLPDVATAAESSSDPAEIFGVASFI
jgi:hypothetical protein